MFMNGAVFIIDIHIFTSTTLVSILVSGIYTLVPAYSNCINNNCIKTP